MNNELELEPNTRDPDGVYQLIIDMHKGLNDDQSQSTNAKLILLLANHIGNKQVIKKAAQIARRNTLNWQKSR